MSTNKMDNSISNLHGKQALEARSNAKPFYQYFTVYMIAICLVVIIALSSVFFLLSQQYKHSQALITEQLVPLQTQFLQQTYLINANKLIDEILQNGNAHEFITLQQELSLQSKNISLLKSQHKNSYQQWFSSNKLATNIVTRIESNHTSNEVLKNKSLILLDTLLDAIKIQLNNQQTNSTQAELLFNVENQLTSIETMLKRLNLKTPLGEFEQLANQINEMFVVDYSKQLANQQQESQGMADIVRDFIRFEDLILKRGVLVKWQGHLRLMDDYQQQLVTQQQQLQSILESLSGSNQGPNSTMSNYVATNKQFISANQLPQLIFVIFALTLSSVAGLLWLMRGRINATSQFSAKCISRAIEDESTPRITDEKHRFLQRDKQGFSSAEAEPLAQKIQQLNTRNHSEVEYLALIDRNQILEEQIVKDNAKQEQLKRELELREFNASAKYKSQLLLEQQRCKALHLAAIKQLVLLGSSAVTTNTTNENGTSAEENYLYYAHLEGRDLVRKLQQASCHRYLQSSDGVLTLSDVNIAGQIQAILLNLRTKLFLCKNRVSVSIDEKILTEVSLDAELFAEMFSVFIRLLFSQQKGRQLALNLQLVDNNNGQQKICFSGQVQGEDKIVQLPYALQGFNDDSTEQSELSDYFITLLHYQYGDDVSAKLIDQGYQFSFTLPLVVARNQQDQSYPVLSLPGHLVDIKNVCVKLAAKYLAMPIEVLLAVKVPEQYQRLQQLLQGMGLQIMFVTCERMLQKNWQSGRFAVLMTEIDCQPFNTFMIDEDEKSSDRVALARGVFSLAKISGITMKSEGYSHWIVGELNAKSAVGDLITAMQPWIKEQKIESVVSEKVVSSNASKDTVNTKVLAACSLTTFNFERYIKHHGSAELAIFMLEEYTAENTLLVEQLSHAFTSNDAKKADAAIQSLLINSKILAADNLLQLCQYWRKLLKTQGLDNSEKVQISLLSKTKQVVQEINQHADAVA